MSDLGRQAVFGLAQLLLALGVALFLPAGTLDFPQAWVYVFVFMASAALITLYLWRHDRGLLERRVKAGPMAEREARQKLIQLFAALTFVGLLVLPALDHRFGWSAVPIAVVGAGDLLVVLGFLVVFRVFTENTFTAGTIEVASGQRVVATGPYALVRHPMYSGAMIMLVGTPLALGSWWGLLIPPLLAVVLVLRLVDEERLLSTQLVGYDAYRQQVRYRLIPRLW